MAVQTQSTRTPAPILKLARANVWESRNLLGLVFMLPAASLLLLFLTYPLGLGLWLGLTDQKIDGSGGFIGLGKFISLPQGSRFLLSIFQTLLYTVVASIIKFGLGLYLALLLNNRMPFKAMIRAIVLLPFVVPTVLSAMAFLWISDAKFSIISCVLVESGVIDRDIGF